MNAYVEITRPNVCALAVLGILIGSLVAGVFGFYPELAYAVIAAFLLCAGGNVINDFFDYNIDKINRPHRPIPRGEISPNQALYYYLALSVVGLAFAMLVSMPFFAIAIFNFAVFTFYPWIFKKMPFVKNLAVAWLGSVSFLAAGLIVNISINTALLLLTATSFVVVLSREILKDIEDVRGDSHAGIRTLPMVINRERAHVLAFVFLYIGCIMLAIPYLLGIFGLYYLIGAIPAVILCIYAARLPPAKAQRTIKVAMYLVFLGFVLGAVL